MNTEISFPVELNQTETQTILNALHLGAREAGLKAQPLIDVAMKLEATWRAT